MRLAPPTLFAKRLGAAAVLLALSTRPALGQGPIADVLGFLVTKQSIPTGDFVKDAQSAEVTRDTITRLLLAELTTLPLSSSSAGFSYRFNPSIGTVERTTSSFGPFFTERSVTSGARQAAFGVSVQSVHYTHLDRFDLESGGFVTTANQFRDERAPFDVETLTLNLRSTSVNLYGNFGLTERVDVGVAVPLVWLSLDGVRVNTYRGAQLLQASAEAEARGVGDVAVRGKVRLLGDAGGGVSVLGEARLPTGSDADLLGSGSSSFRGLVIGSIEPGRWSMHGNAGFTAGGVSDELNYRAAVTVVALPQVTVIGELLGRRIADVGRLAEERAAHPSIAGVDTIRLVTTGVSTNTATVVTGVKWNAGGRWLLNANVSFPITRQGLRPDIVTLFGLDYAFGAR